MANRVDYDDEDRNSSADSDFFSPISASFFRPKATPAAATSGIMAKHQQQQPQGSGEKLPPLHDSSWIGARLSPIGQSFDNESLDDNNNNNENDDDVDDVDAFFPTTVYQRALHESFEKADFIIGSSSLGPPPHRSATEQTRLLSSRPATAAAAPQTGTGAAGSTNGARMGDGGVRGRALPGRFVSNHDPYHNNNRAGGGGLHIGTSAIHPLWNPPPPHESLTAGGFPNASTSPNKLPISWGGLVCAGSGLAFAAMAVHDYLEYSTMSTERIEAEGGSNATDVVSRQWSTPWIRPSYATMYEFGAFAPQLDWEFPLRMVASSFLCSSVVEYTVVLVAWRIISMIDRFKAVTEPWHRWSGMYAASCVAGQLWMTAWDRTTNGAMTGCVAWSTCGVLIYAGMQTLSRRTVCFGTAALLLLLSLLQRPASSVVGTVGACSLGWSLAAAEVTSVPYWPPPSHRHRRSYHDKIAAHTKPSWLCWIGRVLAVKIVVLPTLFISFLY